LEVVKWIRFRAKRVQVIVFKHLRTEKLVSIRSTAVTKIELDTAKITIFLDPRKYDTLS